MSTMFRNNAKTIAAYIAANPSDLVTVPARDVLGYTMPAETYLNVTVRIGRGGKAHPGRVYLNEAGLAYGEECTCGCVRQARSRYTVTSFGHVGITCER